MRVLFNALATFLIGSGLILGVFAVLPPSEPDSPIASIFRLYFIWPAASGIFCGLIFLAIGAALARLNEISRNSRYTAEAMLAIARTADTTS